MSNKTETWNGFETFLTSELLSGELVQMFVDFIPAGLDGIDRPMYLVVEPDKPTQREWIRVKDIDANLNLFTTLTRGLTGGTSDITHPINSVIRSVTTKELVDDLFADIVTLEQADATHADDTGDPHAAAIYLKLAQANSLYVNLTGSVMTGPLTLFGAPTADLEAATRLYVDDAIDGLPIPFSQLHADLTDLPDPSAHHTRYDDQEAQNAMGPNSIINPFHHNRYSDNEVDTIVATHADIVNAHHDRYTDGEAEDAIEAQDLYYTKAEVNALLAAIDASQVTTGTLAVARIPDINASKIIAGTFRTGAWKIAGGNLILENGADLGVDGEFNVNGTVIFSAAGIPVDVGGQVLRLNGGFQVVRSS